MDAIASSPNSEDAKSLLDCRIIAESLADADYSSKVGEDPVNASARE
jgi:hypothetical protein